MEFLSYTNMSEGLSAYAAVVITFQGALITIIYLRQI